MSSKNRKKRFPQQRPDLLTRATNAVLGDPKESEFHSNPLEQRPSGQPPEVKVLAVSDLPADEGWAHIRRKAQQLAKSRGEWAGIPIPSSYSRLILEKRYPYPKLNGAMFGDMEPKPPVDDGAKVVNQWYCQERGVGVLIVEEKDGTRWKTFIPNGVGSRQTYAIKTMGIASEEVWSIEAETEAMSKLKELVNRQAYKCYFLSGMFLETSPRSKVTYLFRKLRPTLAMRPDKDGNMQILTALCLHPLGYYDGTFAGVMTPTDDVIAVLLMMRGDERKFWSKANHHDIYMASAGI